ncbi:hypothetical protein DM860_010074 [Cuscuta australis]|uniref:mitogen-activated protein kinase kinase n=1 Tax=Cuscuta australis TaxID=267555 RepID=A0A328D7Z6_9ASTE|nr:hypothetical protein DM860_010074 [Cuscuta australis]
MAGLEELKKKLAPLFDAEKGFPSSSTLDPSESYLLSDGGAVNLLSRSYGVYNFNELGLQKCHSWPVQDPDYGEKTYRCASHEMRVFGAIGSGASSVVQRAIHIPTHRIIALKKINIFEKGLNYLHGVRHLVHRDIKPANLLVNLKGEPKITDFGISAGLENSMAMCATFVGTVTYMSPERIRNENYSYPADIWSLGLALFECGTGEFPYTANEGPVNLMLQVLLLHPFITKYVDTNGVDLGAFVRSIFDPTQKMKDLADMFTIHYYLLADGSDDLWQHTRMLYRESSIFSFCGKEYVGPDDIFATLSNVRSTLAGEWPPEKLVHVVEKLQCRAHCEDGVAIRVSGSFIVGNQFLICGDGLQVEGMPNFKDLSLDLPSKRMGTFQEQFTIEQGSAIGRYFITKQELYIAQ